MAAPKPALVNVFVYSNTADTANGAVELQPRGYTAKELREAALGIARAAGYAEADALLRGRVYVAAFDGSYPDRPGPPLQPLLAAGPPASVAANKCILLDLLNSVPGAAGAVGRGGGQRAGAGRPGRAAAAAGGGQPASSTAATGPGRSPTSAASPSPAPSASPPGGSPGDAAAGGGAVSAGGGLRSVNVAQQGLHRLGAVGVEHRPADRVPAAGQARAGLEGLGGWLEAAKRSWRAGYSPVSKED